MNIEKRLELVTDLLAQIVQVLNVQANTRHTMETPTPPAPSIPAPTTPPAPPPAAIPDFAIPTPPAAPESTCPLKTAEDVSNYCKHKYQQNPERGAGMQAIIAKLGHTNLTAVRPDQYADLFAQMEQLA